VGDAVQSEEDNSIEASFRLKRETGRVSAVRTACRVPECSEHCSKMGDGHEYGVTLENGCRIVHGAGANIKIPFQDLGFPVQMNELSLGSNSTSKEGNISFSGQFGFIEFDTSIRLPRHIHIAPVSSENCTQRFVAERILVLSGVALVELNGQVYVIPPKTLVTIAGGVPHTWTACPAGVRPAEALGMKQDTDAVVSEGRFLMIYEYEDPTGFFPTKQTDTLETVDEYIRCDEAELNSIRIKEMSKDEVNTNAWFIWDRTLGRVAGR
jgi:hypothetical protein